MYKHIKKPTYYLDKTSAFFAKLFIFEVQNLQFVATHFYVTTDNKA